MVHLARKYKNMKASSTSYMYNHTLEPYTYRYTKKELSKHAEFFVVEYLWIKKNTK